MLGKEIRKFFIRNVFLKKNKVSHCTLSGNKIVATTAHAINQFVSNNIVISYIINPIILPEHS